ncbi:hypothetical protein D3C81_1883180 [compost metagenome]
MGEQLIVVAHNANCGGRIAVTLNTLAQIVFHGLLQAPVAIADHAAIVGVGEQAGDSFLVAQCDAGFGHC